MAPVTRRISNAKQDWLLSALGKLKCLFAPGKPIHWIVSVLKKVRAGLVDQAVCMNVFSHF